MIRGAYAELLVDTARAPQVLGVRGASPDRQLVYRHGGVQLELMVQAGGPATTFLWGQVCRAGSGRPYRDAPVALLDEDLRPVADSRTDSFGEFSFAAPRMVEAALSVDAAGGRFLCWLTSRASEFISLDPEGPGT